MPYETGEFLSEAFFTWSDRDEHYLMVDFRNKTSDVLELYDWSFSGKTYETRQPTKILNPGDYFSIYLTEVFMGKGAYDLGFDLKYKKAGDPNDNPVFSIHAFCPRVGANDFSDTGLCEAGRRNGYKWEEKDYGKYTRGPDGLKCRTTYTMSK